MPKIRLDEINRLKRDIDLVELVRSSGVDLCISGKNFIGFCPFHQDSEPSLVVTPSKNLWHCIGACDFGGDVIEWMMKSQGVSFRHAAEILRKGILPETVNSVKRSSIPTLPLPITANASGPELLAEVVAYYRDTLLDEPGAQDYLKKRGIFNLGAIDTFKIGFANRTLGLRIPASNRNSGAKLRTRLTDVGLIRTSGHEHFNGSIVIPLVDAKGQVVQIYGRKITSKLREGTPDHLYLPGPHQGIFNLAALRDCKGTILCESLIDALTFWCAGYHNVTASFGTGGFTDEMLEAFNAYGIERVLIAYDRDDAGDKAAEKLSKRLAGESISSFRVLFPHQMDANSYACTVTPAVESLGVVLREAEHIGGPLSVVRCQLSEREAPDGVKGLSRLEGVANGDRRSEDAIAGLDQQHSSEDQNLTTDNGQLTTKNPPSASKTQASPVSSAPRSPTLENPTTEIRDHEIIITLADRRWRIRGLSRNLSYEQLRINLLVAQGDHFHVDNLDLYSSRLRNVFLKQAATELQIKHEILGKDLGRVLMKLEEIQDERIKKELEPEDTTVKLTDEERNDALALLKAPDLLDRVSADLEACGLVGENTNKIVAYLAAVSRKLSKPLGILIQSSSAAGKSALMDAVLTFIPPEDRVQYSAMTGQSLFYMGETDLKHKVLAIAEEEGAQKASYSLKLLQSEGELTIASTGKDPKTGRLTTHEYHVEGPSAIILTTTAIDIDEELLNRLIVLSVDESREQTRAIHAMQREDRTFDGLKRRLARGAKRKTHQNAQRLLRQLDVVNPYSPRLTFLANTTRTRRDHLKYHALIETVALVHQHQRDIKSGVVEGRRVDYIEVVLSDIATANRLASDVLGRTLDELPPQTRRLLFLIEEMVVDACKEQQIECNLYRFTRRQVRERTGWGDTQLKIHLHRLEEMEYLLVHSGGRGRCIVYELLYDGEGKDGERFVLGLIDVEKLKQSKSGSYDPNRSGQKSDPSAASRPEVGGVSRAGRDRDNPTPTSTTPGISGNPPKNAHLDPQEEPRIVAAAASYPKVD